MYVFIWRFNLFVIIFVHRELKTFSTLKLKNMYELILIILCGAWLAVSIYDESKNYKE